MALVVDGALAPGGLPRTDRLIDDRTTIGELQNRAVGASVRGGGAGLIDATYEILERIFGGALDKCLRFSARVAHRTGPAILETNPTIGLAVSVEQAADVGTIPGHPSGGGAMSQVYWLRGGGRRVANALGAADAALEDNHDLRAGLYALAVAAPFSGDAADGSLPTVVNDSASGT